MVLRIDSVKTLSFKNNAEHKNVQTQAMPVNQPDKGDEVVINGEKKGLSKRAKWGIGLGLIAGAAVVVGLILRGKFSKAKEAAFQLAEHIDFKKAETVEEARNFAKTHLGIKTIDENIQKVLKEKEAFIGENYKYDCPFLIDDGCSLYLYRGIVCRAFGLIEANEEGNAKIPFCHENGLNYSKVVDEEKMLISEEKYLSLNEEKQPLAYNVSYKFLTSEKMEKEFGFKFGAKKPLIEWFC